MNQIHFSIGYFPAGQTAESEDGPKIYLLVTNDGTGGPPSEVLLNVSEEGWKDLEDIILMALRRFREGVITHDSIEIPLPTGSRGTYRRRYRS